MPSPTRRWLRLFVACFALTMLIGPSCTPGFDPPSKVNSLRIMAVTMDQPYGAPGEEISLKMTVSDGLGEDGQPRDLQILWLGGCIDPAGDQYFLCFEQLAETLAPLADGTPPPADLFKVGRVSADAAASNEALEFKLKLPSDIISRREAPVNGPHYGIAYVFFAACAGVLEPTELRSTGGEVPEFPVRCTSRGEELGSDSFVIGYTQAYAFADERRNANPAMDGLTIDGKPVSEDPAQPTTVKRCPVSDADRRQVACGAEDPTDSCQKYVFEAMVGDVAELDPQGTDVDGNPLREVVWISYFADAGELDSSLKLVSDAKAGLQEHFESGWIPPAEPGIVSVWAVLRDQRGGSTIIERQIEVK